MGTFTSPLIVEKIETRDNSYIIVRGFSYKSELTQETIEIPEGFETDFASIPRGLWNVFPPVGGRYDKAAVVHDWLYRTTTMSRELCDKIFLEAMEVLGVGWWTRRTIYYAVRIFGGFARKDKPFHKPEPETKAEGKAEIAVEKVENIVENTNPPQKEIIKDVAKDVVQEVIDPEK